MSAAEIAPDEELWLQEDEQRAWRNFVFSTSSLLSMLTIDLETAPGIDLTLGEYEILVRLSESPEHSLRMSDLAAQVVHSRSRLTHTITRLEKRGIVERVRCANDGRGREAHLTDEGMALLVKAAPIHVRSVRRHLLDRLGRERFLALGEIMSHLAPEGAVVDLPRGGD